LHNLRAAILASQGLALLRMAQVTKLNQHGWHFGMHQDSKGSLAQGAATDLIATAILIPYQEQLVGKKTGPSHAIIASKVLKNEAEVGLAVWPSLNQLGIENGVWPLNSKIFTRRNEQRIFVRRQLVLKVNLFATGP
jgi:hypothetical protein